MGDILFSSASYVYAMKKEEFLLLAGKIADGIATDEETLVYNTYLNQIQNEHKGWNIEMGDPQMVNYQLRGRIDQILDLPSAKNKSFPGYFYLIGLAASLFIAFSVFMLYDRPTENHAQLVLLKKDIVPGGNKATLTLANGKKIILDQVANGKVAEENDITISKTSNGKLIFQVTSAAPGFHTADQMSRNMVNTPGGGQYQVNLSDGTKVWLNASSSLKFPTAFAGKTRSVELSGEAYFEVAKDKQHPFIVSYNQMSVRVLGTHFNIKAYDDEQQSNTTLLEGSVSLSSGDAQSILKPGEQGLFNQRTGKLAVSVAPDGGDGSVAWKNGDFMFLNEDIYTVMRQISRWYDVDVEYQGHFKDLQFRGVISRFKNISEVLKLLELTDAVHFKVVGRRVIVMT